MTAAALASTRVGERLSLSWQALAVAVFASLLVGEYRGPIIGIAAAITSCGAVMVFGRELPRPRFPAIGYWFLGILALGLISAVIANFSGASPYDIDLQRDIGITLSYLLYLVIGVYFAHSRSTFTALMAAVVAAGMLISVVHLVRLTTVLSSGVSDLYLFRLEAGRGSITQFVALCGCLLLLSEVRSSSWRRVLYGCAALLMISMLATLSRGLMINLIVLALGTMAIAYDRAGRMTADISRFAVTAAGTVAAVVGAYVAITSFSPAVHQFIDEFFITRVTNSANEVAASNLQTRTQIADNYRAFELDQAMLQFANQPLIAQAIGQGWGSTVQFGLETASTKSSFTRTEASFLHNGYAYFLMKTGVAGLLLYIGVLVHLVRRATSRALWPRQPLAFTQRKVLLVLAVTLGIGTVTTGGLGYPATYLGLALLLGACHGPLWSAQAEGGLGA